MSRTEKEEVEYRAYDSEKLWEITVNEPGKVIQLGVACTCMLIKSIFHMFLFLAALIDFHLLILHLLLFMIFVLLFLYRVIV